MNRIKLPAAAATAIAAGATATATARGLNPIGVLEAIAGAALAAGCSTVALTASRRRPLSPYIAIRTVLAVAAAGTVTPAGIGGTALTVRMHRRTGATAEEAAAAVAVRAAAGALVALVVTAAAGALLGGATRLPVAPSRDTTIRAVAVALAVLAAGGHLLAGTARRGGRGAAAVRQSIQIVRHVPGHLPGPRRLTVLTVALLGLTCAQLITLHGALSATGAAPALPLLVGALLGGNAARSASPILPAGIGVVDAVMVAVLAAGGLGLGAAAVAVTLYRAVGHWLPAAAGVLCGARLRTAGLL